jgi:phage terminase Nu1 subunit (DNA packaging protein)
MTLVTRKQLADFTGFAEGTLSKWAKSGMPIKRDGAAGSEWRADSKQVIAWLLERERSRIDTADVAEQRARLLKAQAAHAEMDLAERRGDTVPAEDVVATWGDVIFKCRARLLAIPHIAPPILPLPNDRRGEAQEVLKRLIYEALTELAGAGDGLPNDARERAANYAAECSANDLDGDRSAKT